MDYGLNVELMINLAILATKFGAESYGKLELSEPLSLLWKAMALPSRVVGSGDEGPHNVGDKQCF